MRCRTCLRIEVAGTNSVCLGMSIFLSIATYYFHSFLLFANFNYEFVGNYASLKNKPINQLRHFYQLARIRINLWNNKIAYYNMEQKNESITTPVQVNSQQIPSQKIVHPRPTTSVLANSFFEVTINSQKLSALFNNLDEIILEQNRKMQRLTKDCNNLFSSLDEKIQAESKKSSLLFTKLDLRINESANTQYCYIMDIHKKSQQRDLQLGKKIQAVQSKLGRIQDAFKQDLNLGLTALKREIIGDVKIISQTQIQNVEPSEKKIPLTAPKIDFNYLIEHFEQEIFKIKQGIVPTFDELYEFKEQEKKKKHTQDMIDLTYKKDIQNFKENMKGQQNCLKIIYPTNSKKTTGFEKQEQNQKEMPLKSIKKLARHLSFNRSTGMDQILHGYNDLIEKIHGMQQNFQQQFHSLGELKNKEIVLDEKINIINRKLQKNCFETAEVKTTIRRVQNQKLDEKAIEELRNYIKWAVRDLEEKIGKKCTDEDLQKQKHKLSQKISILHENLIEKADKGEIQKALVFLQGKIKQIIFLIAAEHTQEKQGAIMKTAAKCLSCDKQVERQVNAQADMSKKSQGQYIKSMTHRVRQRYKKQMAKTVGNETFDN